MVLFLLLSLLSGTLELGVLFLGVRMGLPLWSALLAPLAYQAGNLLFLPRLASHRRAAAAGAAGALLLPVNLWLQSPALFLLQVCLASLCIQAARRGQKDACPTWLKRSFRIGGFLLAPLLAYAPEPVLACCVLLPAAVLLGAPETPQAGGPLRLVPTMVFHQMHYFCYAYLLPVWAFQRSGSLLLSACCFALTWVVYLLPQTLAERWGGAEPRRMFFACHGFLALDMAVLCAAALLDWPPLLLLTWLLTGLGGGSVFCIQGLSALLAGTDLTFSENVGHVLGALGAAVLTACCPDQALPLLAGASCLLVCLTLACGTREARRGVARHG